ncbi:MAG: ABC transporter permease [Eubacteriales bacterium]
MKAIYIRELKSYFLSPIAYAFMGTFMLIGGIFFSLTNIIVLSTNFASTLGSLSFVFVIVVPILTMRMFSQERKDKTDQLLLTSGVSVRDIILAKYFSASTVFLVTLLLSLIMPVIIGIFGAPIFGEILCAYIGFLLLGLVMIAVGMFISTTTDSQITAAILTAAFMLLIWVADAAISLVSNNAIVNMLSWLSLFERLEPFILGTFSTANIVYYISFIVLFIYMSFLSIEKRRWG